MPFAISFKPVSRQLKRRLLSVDDDPGIGILLTRLFQGTGRYLVEVQQDPFLALATARRFRPDVLLLDVNMPGQTGIQIAKQLRAEPWLRYRPIILFTVLPTPPGSLRLALGDGPTEFLQKGVPLSEVVAAVDRALGESPELACVP